MPKFALTHVFTQVRQRFRVNVPDAATNLPRVQNGAVQDAAINRDKATVPIQEVKVTTDLDGCPIWVPE